MLEKKLKLRKAMRNLEPKEVVKSYYNEYELAYKRLTKPSEKHKQDYRTLYFDYLEYMNRKDISTK